MALLHLFSQTTETLIVATFVAVLLCLGGIATAVSWLIKKRFPSDNQMIWVDRIVAALIAIAGTLMAFLLMWGGWERYGIYHFVPQHSSEPSSGDGATWLIASATPAVVSIFVTISVFFGVAVALFYLNLGSSKRSRSEGSEASK